MSFSDFNPIRPRNVAAVQTYSDLDLRDPFVSPMTKDVMTLRDIVAVKNAVRNLVLTNFYEAPFDPFRGGNIRALLFENANSYTQIAINKEITRVLIEHEPRVNVTSVDVIDNSDINAYQITINFNIIALNVEAALNFYLERLR
jgi:phage baseplate assembly protein W